MCADLVAEPASGLLIDHVQRRAWAGGAELTLTFQEFELLAFLSAHPGTVFSRTDLIGRVWRPQGAPDRRNVRVDSRTVDVHVQQVREKLAAAHITDPSIQTVWGVGYRLELVSN